mgnify:CR=1 FL=1
MRRQQRRLRIGFNKHWRRYSKLRLPWNRCRMPCGKEAMAAIDKEVEEQVTGDSRSLRVWRYHHPRNSRRPKRIGEHCWKA